MKNDRNTMAGRSAVLVADESFHLLRFAPARLWAAYLAGTVPFVLGFLYFWTDMSRSAFAANYCLLASLGMAVLFVWMKTWHSVFMSGLRHHIRGTTEPSWTIGRVVRMIFVQTSIQTAVIVAMPLAISVALPFAALTLFSEQVSASADGDGSGLRDTFTRAWRHTTTANVHTHILLWFFSPWMFGSLVLVFFGGAWLLSSHIPNMGMHMQGLWIIIGLVLLMNLGLLLAPFGFMVAANVAIVIAALPELVYILTGARNALTIGGTHGLMNSTFLMLVAVLTCMCLDLLQKSAILLRQFYLDSRSTGEDIIADLRAETSLRMQNSSAVASRRSVL